MAISAWSFLSSASSSSSSCTGALLLLAATGLCVSSRPQWKRRRWRPGRLTCSVGHVRHPADRIRDGYGASLEHLLVQLLLLHALQLGFQVVLVDHLADLGPRDGVHDLLAEFVLLPYVFPAPVLAGSSRDR